jgi:hypothetical protein
MWFVFTVKKTIYGGCDQVVADWRQALKGTAKDGRTTQRIN